MHVTKEFRKSTILSVKNISVIRIRLLFVQFPIMTSLY